MVFILSCFPLIGLSQTAEEFITRAENFNREGDTAQAVPVIEEPANKNFPKIRVFIHLYGLYLGTQAFTTKDEMLTQAGW